ncbi:MAG: glycosyltransferase family 39 protein [Chloroflexi bacterium]|nr:glycosyltransferase family 39 protein [Chloroflexota bacterium]MCI0578704.1 glycosyltransferase family 39 protein [Chloroflexota bacterium]MCI0648364.1 glycosyltransferase family 39 protein [Chloroflexota bacterium]MCI0730943.1 glycosyltransferase family 39 protein [Chloroflexota bacterium]
MTYEIKETVSERPDLLAQLTLEHVAYLAIAAVAALVRFAGLGRIPLSPAEAAEALAVWDFWRPETLQATVGHPAYFSLTSLVTLLLGAGDVTMRLAPAFFGLALALLPWLWRDQLGRPGALVASLLLAISPTQSLIARTAGGQSLALFAGLLLIIAWFYYQDSGDRRWFLAVVAALGLGLASAPLFYTVLVTLGLAWLAQSLAGPAFFSDEEGKKRPLYGPDSEGWRQAALVGGGVFLAAATFFLWHPAGLGAAGRLPVEWQAYFAAPTDLAAWLTPFQGLVRYELGLIVLAIPALIVALLSGRPYANFLVYWLIGSLLLAVLQWRQPETLAALTLPATLLVGWLANNLLSRPGSWHRWSLAGAVLFGSGVIYFNLVRYSRLAAFGPSPDLTFHLFLMLFTLAAVLTVIAFLGSWDWPTAFQGAFLGLLATLLLYNWGTGWWISQYAANDTRELWATTTTDDDLRLLAETIRDVSQRVTNSDNSLEIISTVDNPALRWYLRDFIQLEVSGVLPPDFNSQAVITPETATPGLDRNYLGADFGYLRLDTPQELEVAETLRWWLFHQSPTPINEERLIFWLRSDLTE